MAGTKVTLSADAQAVEGRITGKGCLKLDFAATSFSLDMDYKSSDKIVLNLSGSQGVKLSADSTLKLSGGLTYDMVNRDWQGEVGMKLVISKAVAAQLEQELKGRGSKTRLSVTITF